MAEWRIEAFQLDTGEIPAQTFLNNLDGEPRARALALLTELRTKGNELRMPTSRALGGGLFELRGWQVRLFYVFRGERTVVLLDGVMKKRDEIGDAMMKRLRRFQEVLRKRT